MLTSLVLMLLIMQKMSILMETAGCVLKGFKWS